MDLQINKIKRKLAKNKHSEASIFDVHDVVEYGFPSNPTAIAYDSQLGLLALASATGDLRVYGKAGVLMIGKHAKNVTVSQLVWVPNEGRLISLSEHSNHSIVTLFEINYKKGNTIIEQVKEIDLESKKATKCALVTSPAPAESEEQSASNLLLIGTEIGDTLILDVKSFALQDATIHLDVAMQNVPEDFKINPGKVVDIAPHPTDKEAVLLGFEKGLLILWNLEHKMTQGTFFVSCEILHSVAWYEDGCQFLTAHDDGTYFSWSKDLEKQIDGPKQVFPFGPSEEGLQALSNIRVCSGNSGADDCETIVFSGGLPKVTYASVHSLTIKKGEKQVNYEIASKIIDVIVIPENVVNSGSEEAEQVTVVKPSALAVLTDQELIMIDLQSEPKDESSLWPIFKKPYLNSASPNDITCMYLYEDCASSFVEKLFEFGKDQFADVSNRDWPVFGGRVEEKENDKLTVVVTGHYDGTVRFYDTSNGKFNLLYMINLNNYFMPDDIDDERPENEQEQLGDVKLHKIGEEFSSCMDNNRFAICKLYVCPKSENLYVGSHSGQVVVFQLSEVSVAVQEIVCHEVKIVPDEVNFKWKGVHPAKPKDAQMETFPVGYAISFVVQCEPPAPVTAMVANNKYGLIAVGTSHGFGVFDCVNKTTVLARSTLVENDEAASGAKLSKSKSLKEGIRNSFRRLKPKKAEPSHVEDHTAKVEEPKPAETSPAKEEKPESEKETADEHKDSAEPQSEETKKDGDEARIESGKGDADMKEDVAATEDSKTADEEKPKEQESDKTPAEEAAPASSSAHVTIVEPDDKKDAGRVVEARGETHDKTMMSTVRCMFFADTFLKNAKDASPSLWVGTHAGSVYSYLVNLAEERESGETKLRLAKEIRLLHRAPVVFMTVLDHSGFPLPDPSAVAAEKVSAADMSGHHHLLVCSEEQMKLFTLPALKPKYKEKLTAVHGLKVRKAAPIKTRIEGPTSNFLACMLNDGSVCTFSLPALFRQYNHQLVNSDNKIASSYTEFDSDGAAYVLQQTNLIKHYSIFKKCATTSQFFVDLPEGCRPVVEEVAPVEAEVTAETKEGEHAEEVEEKVEEAEKTENVESAPTFEGQEGEGEKEQEQQEDLPSVETEAEKMINDAEEMKDEEFQKLLQEKLTRENPELTVTTVTTYKAIESRTIISADDGTQCSKIITTTRDTTLTQDGDIVTHKTQQKEEFEVSPSEENQPGEEKPEEEREREESTVVVESVSVVDAVEEVQKETETKSGNVTSDDEEIHHADDLKVEATPVRTATLTQNEEIDQVTDHIGTEYEENEKREATEDSTHDHDGKQESEQQPEAQEPEKQPEQQDEPEKQPEQQVEPEKESEQQDEPEKEPEQQDEPEKQSEQQEEPEKQPEQQEPEKQSEQQEEPVEVGVVSNDVQSSPPAPENLEDSEGVKGECYGGSNGNLYSPLAAEEATEQKPQDVSPVEDNEQSLDDFEGACYGGSQGQLYSPLGRESNTSDPNDIIDNGQHEAVTENGDVTNGVYVNGNDVEIDSPQNGLENGGGDAEPEAVAAVKTVTTDEQEAASPQEQQTES